MGWQTPYIFSNHAVSSPDKFYKGRSQEKTHLLRLEFFLLRSPLDGAGSVLTARAKCSVAGPCGPAVWVFSTSAFHRFFDDEACQFRNQQSRTVVNVGDHSSIRDSWPIAFSGYPRGPSLVNSSEAGIVAQMGCWSRKIRIAPRWRRLCRSVVPLVDSANCF